MDAPAGTASNAAPDSTGAIPTAPNPAAPNPDPAADPAAGPTADPTAGPTTEPSAEGPNPDPTGPATGPADPGLVPTTDPAVTPTTDPTAPSTLPPDEEFADPDLSSLLGSVALSTPSQAFQGELAVELTTTIAGAEIRYTTDGSVPTATSTLYAGPLTLTETTRVRAGAFVGGAQSGAITTGLYVARTFDQTSDLPIVVLDSYASGKPTDKTISVDVAVLVFEPTGGMASLSALPTLATRAGYHVRGQSSASFPQTPYKIEFWDNGNEDANYPLLGMPSDSDWALIPPYYDRTLIRNPFVYELGREMGLQAPRWAYAEVYLNYDGGALTQEHYQGIYWVSETIKNQKDRTNLQQLEPEDTTEPDISGGYIFKFDQLAAEEPILECTGAEPIAGGFFGGGGGGFGGGMMGGEEPVPEPEVPPATCWVDLEVIDPEPLAAEQEAWLTSYLQQFHDSLHSTPLGDYAQFIELPTFIDYLIINELTMNVDSYVRSAYYHKDRDSKLRAGPLWDYNFALGGVGAQSPTPETEEETGFMYSGARNVNNWYPKLTSDPVFMAQVKTRYTELRQTLLADAAIEQRMIDLQAPLTQAVERDFAKWPVADIITSETGFTGGPTVATWDGQVQVMHDFVLQRLAWLDANLP
jgi:CotH kinase protein/Chitobiase/beta-hexosaminidase C-terminal domain